jgi:hypothetical protein
MGLLPNHKLQEIFGNDYQNLLNDIIKPGPALHANTREFIDGADFCLKITGFPKKIQEQLWQAWYYAYTDDRYV